MGAMMIVLCLLFMLVVALVIYTAHMEGKVMKDPEAIREICAACMWREVGDDDACKKGIFREALEQIEREDRRQHATQSAKKG